MVRTQKEVVNKSRQSDPLRPGALYLNIVETWFVVAAAGVQVKLHARSVIVRRREKRRKLYLCSFALAKSHRARNETIGFQFMELQQVEGKGLRYD